MAREPTVHELNMQQQRGGGIPGISRDAALQEAAPAEKPAPKRRKAAVRKPAAKKSRS